MMGHEHDTALFFSILSSKQKECKAHPPDVNIEWVWQNAINQSAGLLSAIQRSHRIFVPRNIFKNNVAFTWHVRWNCTNNFRYFTTLARARARSWYAKGFRFYSESKQTWMQMKFDFYSFHFFLWFQILILVSAQFAGERTECIIE